MKSTGGRIFLIILAHVLYTLADNVDSVKQEGKKSKGVNTFVSAKWEATPIVLELAEYLSAESTDLFWSFFDGINSLKSSLDSLGKTKFVCLLLFDLYVYIHYNI